MSRLSDHQIRALLHGMRSSLNSAIARGDNRKQRRIRETIERYKAELAGRRQQAAGGAA